MWESKAPPERSVKRENLKEEPGFPQSRKMTEKNWKKGWTCREFWWWQIASFKKCWQNCLGRNLVYLRTMNRFYFVNCVQRQMFMCDQYSWVAFALKTFPLKKKRHFLKHLHKILKEKRILSTPKQLYVCYLYFDCSERTSNRVLDTCC